MNLLVVFVLCTLSTAAYAKGNETDYMWSTGLGKESAAQLSGPIYISPDACANGNGGIAGVTITECIALCTNDPKCVVVSWYPRWFGGGPVCFAYNKLSSNTKNSATSYEPISLKDQGVYVGVKKSAVSLSLAYPSFKWATGQGVGSHAQQPDPLFVSPDNCKAGNGGWRGLTLPQCLDLCLILENCNVMAYYPVWFKGPSACFAYKTVTPALAADATSSTVRKLTVGDVGNYLAVYASPDGEERRR